MFFNYRHTIMVSHVLGSPLALSRTGEMLRCQIELKHIPQERPLNFTQYPPIICIFLAFSKVKLDLAKSPAKQNLSQCSIYVVRVVGCHHRLELELQSKLLCHACVGIGGVLHFDELMKYFSPRRINWRAMSTPFVSRLKMKRNT